MEPTVAQRTLQPFSRQRSAVTSNSGKISALLAFSLAALIEKERFERLHSLETVGTMKLAVGFLFAGMGLYLLTMYAYDTLLMAVRLWSHARSSRRPEWLLARPPSSSTHILFLNMMHIWTWLFTSATWAVVLGLFCLAWAVFAPTPIVKLPAQKDWAAVPLGNWIFTHLEPIIAALIAGVVGLLYWKGRPVLGSRD